MSNDKCRMSNEARMAKHTIRHSCFGIDWLLRLFVMLMLMTAPGCLREASPPVSDVPVEKAQTAVQLERVGPKELDAAIASYRGKVVLVDFWATWCTNCVALMPHVVELDKKLAPQGLVVLGVSVDDPDEAQAVRQFLEKRAIPFRSFISNELSPQKSNEAFQLEGVPTYRLYDRSGKLSETFFGNFEPADLDKAIAKRLDEATP